MSNNTITSLDLAELDADLARIASRNVILEAAKILAAMPMSSPEFSKYEVHGADEVLVFVLGCEWRVASSDELASWARYQICERNEVDPDQLTLEMVLREMLTRNEEGDEEPDRVTYDEVMRMVIQ
jgi:hypothetical protein